MSNHRSVPVLNVIDLGTNYQVAELLPSKEPNVIWRAFCATSSESLECRSTFQLMRAENSEEIFTQWSAQHGTLVFRAAARARKGGASRRLAERDGREGQRHC